MQNILPVAVWPAMFSSGIRYRFVLYVQSRKRMYGFARRSSSPEETYEQNTGVKVFACGMANVPYPGLHCILSNCYLVPLRIRFGLVHTISAIIHATKYPWEVFVLGVHHSLERPHHVIPQLLGLFGLRQFHQCVQRCPNCPTNEWEPRGILSGSQSMVHCGLLTRHG